MKNFFMHKLLKTKILSGIFFGVALAVVPGCGTRDDDSHAKALLREAIDATQRDDYAGAIEICDHLLASVDTATYTWSDYMDLCTVYSLAYAHDVDAETSMANAMTCLTRARALQPDSVDCYMNALPSGAMTSLHTVNQTLDALNTDRSNIGDHEEEDIHQADNDLNDSEL